MRIVRVALSLVVLLVPVGSVAPSDEHWASHNGEWWLSQTPRDKLSFLEGYITAKSDTNVSLEGLKRSGRATGKEASDLLDLELEASDFYHLSLGQVSDGLDQFYADYKNKMVDFNGAVGYVKHQIKGRPQEQLDRELILVRCEATSPTDVVGCLRASTATKH